MPKDWDSDFLIIGQGLAGSALAMALKELGATVLVVDDLNKMAATRVAAGLITTLAGKGMNPGWRQADYLPEAVAYYQELERLSGKKMLHFLPIVRPFDSEKQREKFDKKRANISEWLEEDIDPGVCVKRPFGSFTMGRSGRLDTLVYLQVVRELLGDSFIEECFKEEDLKFEDEGVRWAGRKFPKVIFCNGVAGLQSKLWSFIPHRSSKGEMLTVRVSGLKPEFIVSCNGWLVPCGDGLWRAGATYQWDELNTESTETGREDVRRRIKNLVTCPFEEVSSAAGVRPIVNNSQPIVGLHPECECVGIFNGLGSRGVMTSRSVAVHFAKYLMGMDGLDPELDFRRLSR